MSRKQEVLLLVPILVLAMAPQLAARAEAPPPAAVEWVPSKAIVVLNVSRPKAVWDVILQPDLLPPGELPLERRVRRPGPISVLLVHERREVISRLFREEPCCRYQMCVSG